jgi:phosphorylcholine metabolism protein LicD
VIRKLYKQLRQMDEVFNKSGIEYFAIGGTLLGAIRHKGIIPWDDDTDVVVPIEQKGKLDNEAFRAHIKKQYDMRLVPHDHFGFKLDYEKDPVVGNHKYHYPFIDVFINMWRNGQSVFDGTMQWPDQAIRKDEVYPLKRHDFGDFQIWVPNKSTEYLDRVYRDWKTHGRLGKRHDLEKGDSDTPVPLNQLPAGPAQPLR